MCVRHQITSRNLDVDDSGVILEQISRRIRVRDEARQLFFKNVFSICTGGVNMCFFFCGIALSLISYKYVGVHMCRIWFAYIV